MNNNNIVLLSWAILVTIATVFSFIVIDPNSVCYTSSCQEKIEMRIIEYTPNKYPVLFLYQGIPERLDVRRHLWTGQYTNNSIYEAYPSQRRVSWDNKSHLVYENHTWMIYIPVNET